MLHVMCCTYRSLSPLGFVIHCRRLSPTRSTVLQVAGCRGWLHIQYEPCVCLHKNHYYQQTSTEYNLYSMENKDIYKRFTVKASKTIPPPPPKTKKRTPCPLPAVDTSLLFQGTQIEPIDLTCDEILDL